MFRRCYLLTSMFRKRPFCVLKCQPPLDFPALGYILMWVKLLCSESVHQLCLAVSRWPCCDIVRLCIQESLDPLPLARVLYFLAFGVLPPVQTPCGYLALIDCLDNPRTMAYHCDRHVIPVVDPRHRCNEGFECRALLVFVHSGMILSLPRHLSILDILHQVGVLRPV